MKAFEFLKNHWYLIALIIIVVMAFTIRAAPARHGELQALDPFYLYRVSELVLTNNFQLPEVDLLRNHPYGDTNFDLLVMHFLPPIMYVTLNPIMQISFFDFALLYPAIMGALSVFVFYFVAKEIFNDRKAGLFAAFFLATVQAFITRTSAGFFEKEPTASVFLFMSVLFFVKAFKGVDWRYGIIAGLMLAITTLSWGGSQYLYLLFSIFALIVSVLNHNTRAVIYAFIPTVLIGMFLSYLIQPYFTVVFTTTGYLTMGVVGIIVLRALIEKFKVVKPGQMKFVTPAIIVIGLVVFLMGTMFSDFLYNLLQSFIYRLTLQDPRLTTVAESVGGDWNVIVSQSSLGAAMGVLSPIASVVGLFSLWTFSVLGLLVIIYKFAMKRDMIYLLPIVWLILSIFGVFFAIRLIYFIGPTVALLAGFLLAWLINKAYEIRILDNVKRTWQTYFVIGLIFAGLAGLYVLSNIYITATFAATAISLFIFGYLIMRYERERSILRRIYDALVPHKDKMPTITAIPVIIIVVFSLSFNAVNAYSYSQVLGPSINQYWYEAMDYMRYQTPENSSLLSWWDFGYWFQTRGGRPTIVDGGGVGNTSRYDVALWFTADVQNWTDYEPWLKEKLDVDYILMDYTLPGKYGAITKISSGATNIVSIMQFQQTGSFPRDNSTIIEFRSGQHGIWLPIQNGAVTSSPVFLIFGAGDQIVSNAYVNDLCTPQGIVRIEDREPSIPGCIAVSQMGVYYIGIETVFTPSGEIVSSSYEDKTKSTIFSTLMFMDGAGLPLEKVFDNTLIKIYKVL